MPEDLMTTIGAGEHPAAVSRQQHRIRIAPVGEIALKELGFELGRFHVAEKFA
jgi:hypothetical protein